MIASSPAPSELTFTVLRLLADGEFHSGEALAQRLGISRASVHNALHGITDYGLILHSVRGRGYRLANPPQWLDAGRISTQLNDPAFHIEVLNSAVSSNTLLLQRARQQAAPSGTVLAVEWQSGGRGRLGRPWHSGLGNALTFSVLWRFDCGLAALSGLSLAVGVALIRALDKLGVTGAKLKWPNDLITDKGKLAGSLIEAQGDMLGPSTVVIGIGLNLALPAEVAHHIDQPVACLADLSAAVPDRNRLLAVLLRELGNMLGDFADHGFAGLRAEWERHHALQNRSVTLSLPNGSTQTGIACGITDDGALKLETSDGMQIINAGEVSLRGASYVAD